MTNAIIDCLMNHRSVRRFESKPLEPTKLELILRAGIRAATGGNLQTYSLVVVDDMDKKRALFGLSEDVELYVRASVWIIALVDQYRMKRWFDLNDAPFYNDRIANVLISFWDAVIALQNIVVAAESLGLGTCYIGDVLSVDMQDVLGVPEYVFPAGLVCVGYPDESPPLKPRLPLEAVVHRNGYRVPTDDEIRAFYSGKDQEWDDLTATEREQLGEQGITNRAQMVTGHYQRDFIIAQSAKILENLERAKFKLTDE